MRIEFAPDLTSETHFQNTGVRFSKCYIDVNQTGNTIVGTSASKASHAMDRAFNYKRVSVEQQIEFLEKFKIENKLIIS